MIGSKLLPLLSSLSPTEFRRMRKVFQSPFFTTNERHLVLYDLLKKHYPTYHSPKLEKEKVFERLYPGKPFNDGLLRVMIREFTQMVEEYLLLSKMRSEDYERKKMLAKIYKDRNLYAFFAKETQYLLKDLGGGAFRDWEYYSERYELNFDYYFHPSTQKLTDRDQTLETLMNSLDKQFLLAKFRLASEMKNREKTLSRQYYIRFLEAIKEVSVKFYDDRHPLFQLFPLLFDLYNSTENEEIYKELKELFSASFTKLRTFDQSLFLTQLINYAIRKINSGDNDYYKEALDLYEIGLETKLVLRNDEIDQAVFGNIVLLGCNAGQFEWTQNFIAEYKDYLKKDIREDVVTFNQGMWYFHQNDFENAYDAFVNYAFAPTFQIKVRLNLVRTLFELFLKDDSYYDLLISHIESFEKYLHRNDLMTTELREADLNTLSVIRRMTTGLIANKDKSKLKNAILSQMEQKGKFVVKNWLLKKIEEVL